MNDTDPRQELRWGWGLAYCWQGLLVQAGYLVCRSSPTGLLSFPPANADEERREHCEQDPERFPLATHQQQADSSGGTVADN